MFPEIVDSFGRKRRINFSFPSSLPIIPKIWQTKSGLEIRPLLVRGNGVNNLSLLFKAQLDMTVEAPWTSIINCRLSLEEFPSHPLGFYINRPKILVKTFFHIILVCPQEESNFHLSLRRATFYPLNYGDKF